MTRSATPDRSTVDDLLRYAVAIGATVVVLLPAARGDSAVGWLPLWLLAMPLCAWACLRLAARHDRRRAPARAAPRRPLILQRSSPVRPPRRHRRPAATRRSPRVA